MTTWTRQHYYVLAVLHSNGTNFAKDETSMSLRVREAKQFDWIVDCQLWGKKYWTDFNYRAVEIRLEYTDVEW